MKTTILMLIAMSPALLDAQSANKAAVAQEVAQYVRTVNEAAATFLNKGLAPAERVKAIEPYAIIYDAKQVEQFKDVVMNGEEPPEIRAAALDRVVQTVPGDERLYRLILGWLGDQQAPDVLRRAALRAEANLSLSNMNLPEVYQKMLDDPEIDFRVFAFAKLISHGDARAQQKLISGLENPETASLPAPTAIGILSMAVKPEFYPAVYKVLLQTRDEATRLEAIRVLGAYPEARKTLIAISRDAGEKEPFRQAALGALYAGDKDNIVQYVTPILSSASAPSRLQVTGIEMTIDVRQAMQVRVKAKRADAYDRLVQKLARESDDPEVRRVAKKYVDSVRPRY